MFYLPALPHRLVCHAESGLLRMGSRDACLSDSSLPLHRHTNTGKVATICILHMCNSSSERLHLSRLRSFRYLSYLLSSIISTINASDIAMVFSTVRIESVPGCILIAPRISCFVSYSLLSPSPLYLRIQSRHTLRKPLLP